MRVCKEQERSRRTNWGGVNDRRVMAGEQLHAKTRTAMVERCLARSRARGWQWQGRLLQGVVVVASQGVWPQEEGHQVAKLEHANASKTLQRGLPCSNLLWQDLHDEDKTCMQSSYWELILENGQWLGCWITDGLCALPVTDWTGIHGFGYLSPLIRIAPFSVHKLIGQDTAVLHQAIIV
jgi:hypothetical protein